MHHSPEKTRVVVLCPVHRDVRFVTAQIDNYFRFHGHSGAHVLHLSSTADPEFRNLNDYLRTPAQLYLNTDSWNTSYRSVFGAVLSNSLYLREHLSGSYTHVYIHTDGDLLFCGDLLKTVAQAGNGFSCSPLGEADYWPHYERCMDDPDFSALRAELGLSSTELWFGRQEGAFFTADLWERIVTLALQFFDRESFANVSAHWPVEEVVIPTLAVKLLGRARGFARPIVRTKEIRSYAGGFEEARHAEVNVVQEEDIRARLVRRATDECLGLKWFSRDLAHPARLLVESLTQQRMK